MLFSVEQFGPCTLVAISTSDSFLAQIRLVFLRS